MESVQVHSDLKTLIDYLLAKTSADQGFHSTLSSLLQTHAVGLVLSERLINMPVQVMPPMYRMLSEEIDEAIEEVRLPSCEDIRCDPLHRVTRINSRTISLFRVCIVCRRKKRKPCLLPNEIRSGTDRRPIPR